jgi:hypothetical protein
MSTFKRYIEDAREILTEKVSKKEITEALKNKNLYVGAEFEMIIPGDQMMGGVDRSEISDAYDNAYRDWQKYMDDISDWEKEAQTYEEETETMSSDIDVLGDAISELDDYANDEEEFQKEWIEGEVLDNWVFTNNHDHVYTIVPGRLHKPFDIKEFDTIKKLEKMIKSLDAVKDDMESTISYREDEGRYEEVTMPYLLDGRFANYIDYMRDIYDNFGYGEDVEDSMKNGEYIPGDGDNPPRPEDYSDEIGGADYMEFEDILNLDDAPFRNYTIGDYGSSNPQPGSTMWAIEPDGSLDAGGVEIKSPPMPLPDFLKIMPKMFDWMDDNDYYTNNSTGFHIHMSFKKPSKDFDALKLVLFTDEGYIFDKFSSRINNQYVKSVKEKLKKDGLLKPTDRKKLFDEKKLILNYVGSKGHFDALNVVDLEKNHVEFRYMGSDYMKKEKDINSVIGNYAHNMSLAADPEYKRKEYVLKLQRIFNKMEYFATSEKLDKLKGIIQLEVDRDPEFDPRKYDKLMKKWETIIKSLGKVYKIKRKDKMALIRNNGFMNSIDVEFQKEYDKIK